jgi:UDP-glucose 4-epimerase
MRILIVGGGSFIAAHAARQLLADGHEIAAYDIDITDNAIHHVLTPAELVHINFLRGDVLDGVKIIAAAVRTRAESIIHLAAALIPLCRAEPALGVRINCDGLNHSFEAARILGLRRVVWASSIAVYGPQRAYAEPEPDETAAHLPHTVYGACKSLNEQLGMHYAREFGVDNIGLRFTNVYGPGRRRGGWSYQLVTELIVKPARGERGHMSHADTLVNWQHVGDAAQAIVRGLYHEERDHSLIYNSGGDRHTVREAAEMVRRILPGAEINCESGDHGEIARLNTARIERELGYRPAYTLDKGLEQSLAFYRRR